MAKRNARPETQDYVLVAKVGDRIEYDGELGVVKYVCSPPAHWFFIFMTDSGHLRRGSSIRGNFANDPPMLKLSGDSKKLRPEYSGMHGGLVGPTVGFKIIERAKE